MNDASINKGKFSNIFIKLIIGIMSRDLKNVKHFLSDEVYNYYQKIIEENINNHEIHCYDEPNVKEILITKEEQDEKYDIAYVSLVSLYMDYYVDSESFDYKRGINNHRVEVKHNLVFKKLKNSERPSAVKCPGCGANLDANKTGICEYCGMTYSALSYDYVLYEVTNL